MKEAKGTHEKALLDLQQLCGELMEPKQQPWRSDFKPSMLPTPASTAVDPSSVVTPASTAPSASVGQEQAAFSTRDADQDDSSWRTTPITELRLDEIKGLGQKKREALVDLCPTIGSLEDLRARVGRDAASLPELMPKGIGRAACDQLEEMLLDWLGKRQSSKSESGPEVLDGIVGIFHPEPAKTEPLSHEDQVSKRAAEIDTGKPNCLACAQSDDGIWKSGYRAFEEDASLWDCPWTSGENQDEWIRGYLAAKAIEVYEGKSPGDGGETDDAEPACDDIDSL